MTHFHKATWSNKLIGTTGVVLAILAYVGWQIVSAGAYLWLLLLLAIVGVALGFAVRGYAVAEDAIIVQHIGWQTTLPLAQLKSAEIDPAATAGSIRIFGIGGLFGFIGRFRNRQLGGYTAYMTNANNSVVLRFSNKIVVISPDNPAVFVEQLEQKIG